MVDETSVLINQLEQKFHKRIQSTKATFTRTLQNTDSQKGDISNPEKEFQNLVQKVKSYVS